MTAHAYRHAFIQFARRGCQIATVAVMVALPSLSLYAHYRAANAIDDIQMMEGYRGALLDFFDGVVSPMHDPQAFLDQYKGTLWSMRLAGIDVADPLAAAEVITTSKTIYLPFLVSILIPLAATLMLGRIFCSWFCPANLFFELAGKLRKILQYAELSPGNIRFSLKNKYVLLGVGLLAAAVYSQPLFALFYPPAVLSRLAHSLIFGTACAGMLLLMLVLTAVELFVSPRWWCRTMCPGGALYALVGWPRVLRVRVSQERCTTCGRCTQVCDPGINPVTDSEGIECTNCAKCVKCCPQKALFFTIGPPVRRPSARLPKSLLPRAVILCVVTPLLVVTAAPRAQAHHILGLPHYSYKENYPQAPTLEYPSVAGPYDVLLTSYPGKPVPKETASLSIYVKNKKTGDAYDKPITVRVLQTFTFGRSRTIIKPTISEPFEQPHKFAVTFPANGEYVVELTMDVEGTPEVIPFMLTVGKPSATISVLITISVLLFVFIITVRAIKIKRARRSSMVSASPDI